MSSQWIDADKDFGIDNESRISDENELSVMNHRHHHGKKLARAYVVFQNTCKLYPIEDCLKKGTAFPDLFDPYYSEKPLSF